MESEYPILIDTFLDDSEQRLVQLQRALLARISCLEALGMAAHSFKGSCGNMGALRLAELCGQLEERTLRGEIDDAPEWVSKIAREFATVRRLFSEERKRYTE
ncbi:Hpt domain-containing protein [Pseudomonas sp. 10B1]|uniref:Hpt domain-containing protein n=1 Tax=unclassified Pseudomonas TaxID=196821 RepID=UPI002AB56F78|nr:MULTISPECIES: Hpt domain-containing protein [unclassified Pseudomonas]MDY7560737.1 Hpt domain-containing protein [Pseudomonas sp. AB6]MEA9978143.1 Hpt domain-containing protein [Pseudomonas sp. RTS4]MEA9996025.1 Hpt domain-containing protein [Pseudomonas sp. AA4]MEB0087348.1 Hpt domain-containing protein [Pseudomonas sp. RTI1]MEB0127920.1 Hpt domain-containing protein [Pseudomonas sp. CCC1.2]